MVGRQSEKTHMIYWDVPLSQFFVDRCLFHPKPTLWSPNHVLNTDYLTLQWQLSLEQDREDARLYLHHRTPDVPNQGVNYTILAIRHDGSTVELTKSIRAALNHAAGAREKSPETILVVQEGKEKSEERGKCTCGPPSTTTGTNRSGGSSKRTSWFQNARFSWSGVEKLIWNGDTVKIRVVIEISNEMWSPRRVVERRIREWKGKGRDGNEEGVIGDSLWSQVGILKPNESPPFTTDLILCCPSDERIAAHKYVVAAFSESFRHCAINGKAGLMVMNSSGIGTAALYEMLHFLYCRSVSPKFSKAPLNELLEAIRIFQLPNVLRWEVEKVLVQIMDKSNMDKMNFLARKYGLTIVTNMLKKVELDAADNNNANSNAEAGANGQNQVEEANQRMAEIGTAA